MYLSIILYMTLVIDRLHIDIINDVMKNGRVSWVGFYYGDHVLIVEKGHSWL